MKRKLLCVILTLCMAMTLLPTVAAATEAAYVKVGGVNLNSAAPYWKNGDTNTATGTVNDWNAKFENGTLTLKDAVITGASWSDNNYGIFAQGDLNIVLEGSSTVTAADSANGHSIGISVGGTLSISGADGSLAVSSGAAEATDKDSDGIYTTGAISITGGTVAAIGGVAANNSCGIKSGGAISITGGTVTAMGGSGKNAFGIYTSAQGNSAITISGSAHVTAIGGTATDYSIPYSIGISAERGSVNVSGNAVTIALGGTATTENYSPTIVASWGIYSDVTLSDRALLIAVGGAANANGGNRCSYGVSNRDVTYNGGVLVARGGAADDSKALFNEPNKSAAPSQIESGSYDGAYYALKPSGSSPYHVAVGNTDATAGSNITWSGENNVYCTLQDTVIIGGDSGDALTIPEGGKLTCLGVNVVLGRGANGVFGGGDLTIDGSGTLTSIGGISYSSGYPGFGIMANSDLTIAGSGRVCGIGSNSLSHPGCGIGINDYVNSTISITGGRGMAVTASGDGGAFFNSDRLNHTAATLLGGAWDGRTAVWRAASAAKAITGFTLSGVNGTISGTNIAVTVPHGTNVTSLAPTITHTGVSIAPTVAQNFTAPVTYTVTAENGTTQNYTVTVTEAPLLIVATPTASPAAGTYTAAQSVTLTCATDGANIYYTLDGSEPMQSSQPYSGTPIRVTESTTIKARAFKADYTDSAILSAAYTINPGGEGGSSGGGSYTPPALVTEISSGGSSTGDNLDRLISGGKTLTVDDKTTGAALVFNTEALKGIDKEAAGSVQVEIKDFSKEHQDTHAGKTVFSLSVTSGGKTISNFGGSVTVSLPYKLKSGEKADEVTVWYLADNGAMTEIPCTYDAKTKLATFTVTHFSEYVVGVKDWVNPFIDVKQGSYYYDAVRWAAENGVTSGTTATTFAPNTTCTRAQAVTFLWRAMGSPEPAAASCPFADVKADCYYYKAVLWAVEKGITKGTTDTAFTPDAAVTRGQVVTFQWRAAGFKSVSTANPFKDVTTGTYFADAVLWAVKEKITDGTTAETFSPVEPCTRAQIVTFLFRQPGK